MKISKNIVIYSLIILMPLSFSCSSTAKMKRQEKRRHKKNEKLVEERQKEAEKQYEEAMKRHWKNQTTDTKKRMKNTAKQSEGFKDGKREFFLARWWKNIFGGRKYKRIRQKDLK